MKSRATHSDPVRNTLIICKSPPLASTPIVLDKRSKLDQQFKKKMSVLQSAVFSAQGTNTVRQALKKIKKKPDAWKKLEFVVAAASSLRVTMEGHVDAGDILSQ